MILNYFLDKLKQLLGRNNKTMAYTKPSNLLIYYGWMSSFNSADNGWDNEKVAQDMARYELVVLGAGIQDSSHGDYSNSSVIIPRILELNPDCKVFGYISATETESNFESKVDDWKSIGVNGIFFDEAGYDYGTVATNGRAAINSKVDYVHGEGMICFMNAWNIDHIIGTENDASYPNSTWNSPTKAAKLNSNDWYLLESFAVNTVAYTGDLATASDMIARGEKATARRETYSLNLAAVNVVDNNDSTAQSLATFAFEAACMYAQDANGSSDEYYGASTAKSALYDRPEMHLTDLFTASPAVEQVGTTSVYLRYTKGGRLKLDFSAKTGSIEEY